MSVSAINLKGSSLKLHIWRSTEGTGCTTKNLSYFPNSINTINFKRSIPELRKPDLELDPIQVPWKSMEPLSRIVKREGLGLCPCLVLDMYFSMVHIFPIYNANFSLNFFFLCLEYYLLLMSIKSILVLSYSSSLCVSASANFPLNCYPPFEGKVVTICSTFGHKLHFRYSFRRRKHILFLFWNITSIGPMTLTRANDKSSSVSQVSGTRHGAEDMGIAGQFLFHASPVVQRPAGESSEQQGYGILSSG